MSDSNETLDAKPSPPKPPAAKPRRRKAPPRKLLKAGLLGGLVGLIASIVALVLIYRRDLPRIEREQWHAARAVWAQAKVTDYDISVEVDVQQPVVYDVKVRGGEVLEVRANGRALTRRHAFETWSVPGMFETLNRDLQRMESPDTAVGGKECRIFLRGKFDERYGYPTTVLRVETREKGTNPEVTWRVRDFRIVTPEEKRQPSGGTGT